MHNLYQKKLKSGVHVVYERISYASMVSIHYIFNRGHFTEKFSQKGMTTLLSSLMDRGCKGYTENQMQRFLHRNQIDVEPIMGNHFFGLEAFTPLTNYQKTFTLMTAMLQTPTLDSDHIEEEKKAMIEDIVKLQDDPEEILVQYFFDAFFSDHPYAKHAWGSVETIQNITKQDLQAHLQYLLEGQAMIHVVGNIDPDELFDFLNANIQDLISIAPEIQQNIPFKVEATNLKIASKFTKLYGIMGFPICTAQHQDRFALDWIRTYFINGQGGKLFEKIREEHGLVYSIDCTNSMLRYGGCMLISYSAESQAEESIDQLLEHEIAMIQKEKISSKDFEKCMNYIEGSSIIEWDPPSNHASFYDQAMLYGTSIDYQSELTQILSLTPDDILRVARTYFSGPRVNVKMIPKL